mmetsp:Transcript_142705/g.346736  ORF Transcript_142705/g.346736 Transcript_142705/m.346736 type:complete len:93 (+) Transcript_142705:1756-2034(+)
MGNLKTMAQIETAAAEMWWQHSRAQKPRLAKRHRTSKAATKLAVSQAALNAMQFWRVASSTGCAKKSKSRSTRSSPQCPAPQQVRNKPSLQK